MAASLPYLPSYKNVGRLFSSIASAQVPESFSQSYLSQTLGLKASSDRPLIPMLRALGFIDHSGRPTPDYRQLKNRTLARTAIGMAIRKAYAPLFAANESAHALTGEELRGLIAQVAGTDEEMTKRIAYTFSALVKEADLSKKRVTPNEPSADDESHSGEDEGDPESTKARPSKPGLGTLRSEFHYNLQIHLPANGTEETYLNIFNALRRVFQ